MNIFKKLKRFYWPYKKYFIWSIIGMLIVTVITVVYPIILQITIDEVVAEQRYGLIPYICGAFLGLMMIKGVSTFFLSVSG